MATITNEYMREMLTKTKEYCVVLLKPVPHFVRNENTNPIIWEHGRRNFELRANGLLSIVCPVPDQPGLCGVSIFNTSPDAARKIMEQDPGVLAGLFTFEVFSCRSFPGDSLPY